MVIDPGTGAYYEDDKLRAYLASWEAHNGPHPVGLDFPKRLGPFLWAAHHAEPNLKPGADTSLSGELSLPSGLVKRTLVPQDRDLGWQVHDTFQPHRGKGGYEFCVHWQFAPGARLEKLAERTVMPAWGTQPHEKWGQIRAWVLSPAPIFRGTQAQDEAQSMK